MFNYPLSEDTQNLPSFLIHTYLNSYFLVMPLYFSDVLELEVYKKGDYVVREVGSHTCWLYSAV